MSDVLSDDWRSTVPEVFRDLPNVVSTRDIAELLGFGESYVRGLRVRRVRLNAQGMTGPHLMALPDALPVSRKPLYWRTKDIADWIVQSGRYNLATGRIERLQSPGRTPHRVESD